MKVEYYTEKDFKTSSWNGGKTTECLIFPPTSSYAKRDFALRLSSATVDLPVSNFTHLQGITRFITCLSYPILLEVEKERPMLLYPFEVFRFSGNVKTKSYGMTQDFNLMLDTNLVEGYMETSKDKERLFIDVKKNSAIWFFNFLGSANLIIDGKEFSLKPFSLLKLEVACIKKVIVNLKSSSPIIYGKFDLINKL